MLGFDRQQFALCVVVFDRPLARDFVIRTARHSAPHLEPAAQRFHLFRARFPHHAGTASWIAKRMDERLDDLAPVAVVPLRNEGVLDRASERKSPDPLRGPVCGDFLAAHPPDLFGIALEECIEQAFAELIAYPLFEVARVTHWKESGFQPREGAESRFENAEPQPCLQS